MSIGGIFESLTTTAREDYSNIHSLDLDEDIVEADAKFLFVIMLLSILWFLCLGISTANHHVEAFTKMLQTRLLQRSDSSESALTQFERKYLRDLSPPFALEVDDDAAMAPDVTHFCFLIHGHRGLSKDLTYMQAVMQRWAAVEKRKRCRETSSSSESFLSNDDDDDEGETPEQAASSRIPHDLVIHNAVCNEGKTTDGVRNGGNRLVQEIRGVIEREIKLRHPDDVEEDGIIYDITISLLGNSLGGLFGRYAIAELIDQYCTKEDDTDENSCWVLDGKYRLHLNIFCTTATPHLGVSRHTYLPIPRIGEIGVAHALGDTGRDLFRLNDLLYSMSTKPKFLEPLAQFRKRIAYANVYGTDFPVPATTAAFLSENSTYPHLFEEEDMVVDESGFVIATLHTPPEKRGCELQFGDADGDDASETSATFAEDPSASLMMNNDDDDNNNNNEEDHEEQLHQMSVALDKLGWKKVFVDIRRAIPSVELPTSLLMRRQNSPSRLVLNVKNQNPDDEPNGNDTCNNNLHSMKESKKTVESRDIASAVYNPTDNRISLPLGHNMIVAFSRSRISTYLNKGGRPVVDALAKELVEDIFTWDIASSNGAVAASVETNQR